MSTAVKIEKEITGTQLPNSRRIYIDGKQPRVRVPFREIDQNPTRNFDNSLEENPPVRVYDTSGPYGDPSIECDVREGLSALRRDWIVGRGDVEEYEGRDLQPIDDGYLTFDAANQARQKVKAPGLNRLEDFPALCRTPLRAKAAARVTQMHYATQGIITPELEFIAIRENLGRIMECGDLSPLSKAATSRSAPNKDDRSSLNHQHRGEPFGASIPEYVTPEFVRDEVARGRPIIPATINHPESQPM